jgi:hypothetical protein
MKIRTEYKGAEMHKRVGIEVQKTRMSNQSLWYMYQQIDNSNRMKVDAYNKLKIKFINEKELLTYEGRQKELAILGEVFN